MASVSGESRQSVQKIALLIKGCKLSDAEADLTNLMYSLDKEELLLLSPEINDLISLFLKKRKKKLSELLQGLLSGELRIRQSKPFLKFAEGQKNPLDGIQKRHSVYSGQLDELRDHHIFQWATFYNDTARFIFNELFTVYKAGDAWQEELESVSKLFTQHAAEISRRGYEYSVSNGVSEQITHSKSLGGLQQFLYLLINLYIEQRDTVSSANEARLTWDIISSLLAGVIRGYGYTLGWELLLEKNRYWVPAVGFLTGADALPLLHEATAVGGNTGLFSTIVPTLLAFDGLANKYQGANFLLPRLSRVALGEPLVLDITLTAAVGVSAEETSVLCFFGDELSNRWEVERANESGAAAVVACLSTEMRSFAEATDRIKIIDASEVARVVEHAQNFSEVIKCQIEHQLQVNSDANKDRYLVRNYAKEFPLEDPDFRRLFMVERHSVKLLLEQFEHGTGINLWCSVRRSGKTTAASNLADSTGRSVVIFQSMDHQPHQPQFNIFEKRVREVLTSGFPLDSDFLEGVIDECAISTAPLNSVHKKRVFVIDEYESFFGLLSAMTRRDPDLRYLVAQPLLSQMVSFSRKNLLIFMGQRPDAHYILSAQNQLSPLAKQFNFPLFEHHASSSESEFAQLTKRVLSPKLPFTDSFVDALFAETSGHPYLTVNLLVDMCDWLIGDKAIESQIELNAATFAAFTNQRLTPAALQRSSYYRFFQSMLSEYLSESSRTYEPWLHCIASVLRQIARKHPKLFSCSIVKYGEIADASSSGLSITRDQLLASAVMSNFLKSENGHVKPAIRLLARLAGCAATGLN